MKKVIIVIGLILSGVGVFSAQDTISPELQNQLDEIETITSDIRYLDRLEETILAFPTPEDLEIFLRGEFDAEFSTEEFADDLLFYVALDLMEPDVDLEATLFDFLLSQIAGYYDPEVDAMNVILMTGEQPEDSLPILENITYSHEYVHALQDQHFDLEALLDNVDESSNADYQLAVLALIEGDATQVMTEYMIVADLNPLELMQAILSTDGDVGGLTIPESVPEIIEVELLFPYLRGQMFVAEVVEAQGWEAINDAFSNNLPQSTEHIYHPERYLAGDMPIEVSLPDISEQLGEDWRVAQDTPVGEFYLRQYLGTQLQRGQVSDMATGWGGDHMMLYINDATNELAWTVHQIWDTPEDAQEFAEGYVKFLDLRFGNESENGACWVGEDFMCFIQIDEDETRISSATTIEHAMVLLGLGV